MLMMGQVAAQDSAYMAPKKSDKKVYTSSASETIFSWGNVEAKPLNTTSIVRLSAFFHLGQHINVDFNEHVGFFSGIHLRNVGMINDLNDTVRVKSRVYTAGIPVGLKFGNLNKTHAAIGAEAEFALNFKQKVFVNDEKSKTNVWFSDRTNIFLPSLFGELRFKGGFYLKYKYYLVDILKEDKQKINVPGVDFRPTRSQMMYVSLGFNIRNKDVVQKTRQPETRSM